MTLSRKAVANMAETYAYRVQLNLDRSLNHEDDAATVPAGHDAFDHEVEAPNAVDALKNAIAGVYHQHFRVGRRHLTLCEVERSVSYASINRLDDTAA